MSQHLRKTLLVAILCLPAVALAQDTSREVAQLLGAQKFWISGTYLIADTYGLSGLMPLVHKKWSVKNNRLVEITTNSTQVSTSGKKTWFSENIDLKSGFPLNRISSISLGDVNVKSISKNAFVVSGEHALVIFRTGNSDNKLLPPTKGYFKHMMAPIAFDLGEFGFSTFVDPLPQVPHNANTPLRHNLRFNREVYVSANFPKSLLQSVDTAISQWNLALGKKYYQLKSTDSLFTQEQCLAMDHVLCIFWTGSESLAWANYGAMTAIFYDPAVGYILGGAITVANVAPQVPAQNVSPDILAALNDPNTGGYYSGFIWAQTQYRSYINPDPVGAITGVLVHEMGHDQGFRHYFAGSLHNTSEAPSDTVMDYPPFPLFSKMQQLGPRDIAKVDALYRNGDFGTETAPEMPCSDGDVLMNPLCNPQDEGDPSIFYSYILQNLGPFYQIFPVGGVAGAYNGPQPVLWFVAKFLVPNPNVTTMQKFIVEQTLCSQKDRKKIVDYLASLPNPATLSCATRWQ